MKDILEKLRRLFTDESHVYYVRRKDIKVNPDWQKTKIGRRKFSRKMQYYDRTGELESKIIIDNDFNLLDGYSSYVIAKINGIYHVPVYFRNK